MAVTNSEVSDFLCQYSGKEFQWGKFDCADFFSDCLMFLVGFDYTPIYKNKWSNKRQAMRFFSQLTFLNFINEELEFTEQNVNSCKTGDLCVFTCGNMHTVGMVYDTRIACVVEGIGLTYADIFEVTNDIIKIIRVKDNG